MAELLVLEFDAVDETDYANVSAQLGVDPQTGAGDWPPGLITHLAGLKEGGSAYVIEVWESQQAQAEFMQSWPRPCHGSRRSYRHSESDLGTPAGPSEPRPLNSRTLLSFGVKSADTRHSSAPDRDRPAQPGSAAGNMARRTGSPDRKISPPSRAAFQRKLAHTTSRCTLTYGVSSVDQIRRCADVGRTPIVPT
jgi:hypothetical protein